MLITLLISVAGLILPRVTAISDKEQQELQDKWGSDWGFSGVSTFAHLPHVKCLLDPDTLYDIGIIGVPFDTAVSYRPGARFGPRAIRAGSSRQIPLRGYNPRAKLNPYASWATILDCGDIPVTPFDNALALRQMTTAYHDLAARRAAHPTYGPPRLLTLGGDHSLALAALRAAARAHGGPVRVVHFDAHLDTWHPAKYGGNAAWIDPAVPAEQRPSAFNHGSMFWLAWHEGLVANGSVHAGLRTRLAGVGDVEDDGAQGWLRIWSDEIALDRMGPSGVAKAIVDAVGTQAPVYLSVDIDVLDPGFAPATGTPEPGGWMTRELIQVLRGIEGLNLVGADIVEVSPAYDGAAEQTGLAAAQVAFELLTSMVKQRVGVVSDGREEGEGGKDEL